MKKMVRFIAFLLIMVSIIGTIPVSAYTPDDEEAFNVYGKVSEEAHYFVHYDYPMDDFYGNDTIKYLISMSWKEDGTIWNHDFIQKSCYSINENLWKAHGELIGNFDWNTKSIRSYELDCSVLLDWYLGNPFEFEKANPFKYEEGKKKNAFLLHTYGSWEGNGNSYPVGYGVYGITRTLYFTKYLKKYKAKGYKSAYDMWKADTKVFRDYMDYHFAQMHKRIQKVLKGTIDEDGTWYRPTDEGLVITPIAKGSNKRLQALKKEFSKTFTYTKKEKKLKKIKISNKKLKNVMPKAYRTKLTDGWNYISSALNEIEAILRTGMDEEKYENIEATLEYLECFEWEYRHIVEIADKIAQRNLNFDTWSNLNALASSKKKVRSIFGDKNVVKNITSLILKINE